MLYYIHIQETIGDFNESIIWLRNVDYEEAVELIQNNSPAFCNNISFSIPYHLEPTIITNDLTLSLLFRNAFDLNEFISYCGLVIENAESRPFYYQQTNFNSKYSRFIIQAINQILIGNYSFAKGKLTQPHRTILKEFLLENKKEVIDMVFFEYDAEAEKRVIYKDGVEEGRAKEIVRSCKDFNLSKEDAIHKLETLLSIPTQSAIDYYEKFSKEFENEFSKAQKIM